MLCTRLALDEIGTAGRARAGSRQATHVIGTAALPADPPTLGVVHSRARQPIATLLVTLSALLLIAGVVGIWSSRTALDTPRWVATVTPLANDADVDAALAQYLTDQFQQIRLLMRFSGLAGQPVVHDSIAEVLRSPQFPDIWSAANQQAHAEFVAMLEKEQHGPDAAGQRHGDPQPAARGQQRPRRAQR